MQLSMFFSSPYLVIVCFLTLIISGEHVGGFYFLYLIAAPVFSITKLSCSFGLLLLLFLHHFVNWRKHSTVKVLGNITGVVLLFASVYYFFKESGSYNYSGTFNQTVPIITFWFTGIVAATFILFNVCIWINIRHGKVLD
ncbi:hypothetical protein SAMN05444008_105203 [Cnuella takakiae]|uniref:Uncharacterized protein n=1 Tax=Cnuella takakiae TaxID=1302690 RepID=A0A1M4ZFF4_9BACT|nr:hypothetical protein [Cnuella takakiae]SHF16698.1 hypothetical protein SAMN05444008_105203 [Cnuella takakiae]